ncbi:MAG: diguanylate cyclase [Candidatus Eremiobacteraeota bacterium]|nr:diguanylate cyclase [Candidatus Eremiobacteraeota bacterium]
MLNLEACAREPIHIIGSVQAHGLLVAVSEPDLVVHHISANAFDIVGTLPEELLERSLEALLGARQFVALRSRVLAGDLLAANPFRVLLGAPARALDCIAHRHAGMLVLEFEPVHAGDSLKPINVAAHLQAPLTRMERAPDFVRLASVAAAEVRRLSGFDRVMIYRFAANWEGDVIAEASAPSPVSYLNLRFPASDIPAQARRLYLLNTLRLIADVQSLPVPIVPAVRPHNGSPLDLSYSILRSASPTHIAYLRNMGAAATLTISIVVNGKLWGMIACHHGTPRRLDYETRSVCDLVAVMLASQIVSRTDNLELQARLRSRDLIEEYMSEIERGKTPVENQPIVNERLLDLLDADGLVARSGGGAIVHGTVVDEATFAPVLAALRALAVRGIASSEKLEVFAPAASAFRSEASGALYIGLSETTDDYILLLRRELIATVTWAGDPQNAALPAGSGNVLRPRTSFAAWQETVRGQSRPWTELELANARLLREQFLRVREARERFRAEERVRYLAHYDALTEIANRSSIQDQLKGCLSQASADRSELAVLFIDLDKFKNFNDAWGHATGDRVLQIVAARMKHSVRAEDVVGRLAGDEFIVIMPGLVSADQASAAARRLLTDISRPMRLDHGFAHITASIGVSRFPVDATDFEGLLSHSDSAMYAAKAAGRNASAAYGASARASLSSE